MLVNYIEAVHFEGFESEGKFFQMSSFGEFEALEYCIDPEKSVDFVKYNSRQISRIYPGVSRQDSSNLKPFPVWNAGCQIGKILTLILHFRTKYLIFIIKLSYLEIQ